MICQFATVGTTIGQQIVEVVVETLVVANSFVALVLILTKQQQRRLNRGKLLDVWHGMAWQQGEKLNFPIVRTNTILAIVAKISLRTCMPYLFYEGYLLCRLSGEALLFTIVPNNT